MNKHKKKRKDLRYNFSAETAHRGASKAIEKKKKALNYAEDFYGKNYSENISMGFWKYCLRRIFAGNYEQNNLFGESRFSATKKKKKKKKRKENHPPFKNKQTKNKHNISILTQALSSLIIFPVHFMFGSNKEVLYLYSI